jgi:hypothetical protein
MRIGNSATVTRQPAAQTSGSDTSIRFAQPGTVTQLGTQSLRIPPTRLRPLFSIGSALFAPYAEIDSIIFSHLRTLSFSVARLSSLFSVPPALLVKNTGGGGWRSHPEPKSTASRASEVRKYPLEVKLEDFDYSAGCKDMAPATTAQNPSHHGITGSLERGRYQCPAARPARPSATLRNQRAAAEEETFPCPCTMLSSSAADAPA